MGRSAAAWQRLAGVRAPTLPCEQLDGRSAAGSEPLQQLLELAPQQEITDPQAQDQAAVGHQTAEPMAVDDEAATPTEDAGCEQYASVCRSLYHLLTALQDAEVRLPVGLCSAGAAGGQGGLC